MAGWEGHRQYRRLFRTHTVTFGRGERKRVRKNLKFTKTPCELPVDRSWYLMIYYKHFRYKRLWITILSAIISYSIDIVVKLNWPNYYWKLHKIKIKQIAFTLNDDWSTLIASTSIFNKGMYFFILRNVCSQSCSCLYVGFKRRNTGEPEKGRTG